MFSTNFSNFSLKLRKIRNFAFVRCWGTEPPKQTNLSKTSMKNQWEPGMFKKYGLNYHLRFITNIRKVYQKFKKAKKIFEELKKYFKICNFFLKSRNLSKVTKNTEIPDQVAKFENRIQFVEEFNERGIRDFPSSPKLGWCYSSAGAVLICTENFRGTNAQKINTWFVKFF